jgi:hypothetical protein
MTIPSDAGVDIYPEEYAAELLWIVAVRAMPQLAYVEHLYRPAFTQILKYAMEKEGVFLVQAHDPANLDLLRKIVLEKKEKITFRLAKQDAPVAAPDQTPKSPGPAAATVPPAGSPEKVIQLGTEAVVPPAAQTATAPAEISGGADSISFEDAATNPEPNKES